MVKELLLAAIAAILGVLFAGVMVIHHDLVSLKCATAIHSVFDCALR